MLYRHIIAEVRVVNPVTGPADQLATKKAAAQMLYNEPLHFDHQARACHWRSAVETWFGSRSKLRAPPQRVGQYALPSQRAHFAHRQKHLLAALLAIQRAVAAVADAVEIQENARFGFPSTSVVHSCLFVLLQEKWASCRFTPSSVARCCHAHTEAVGVGAP